MKEIPIKIRLDNINATRIVVVAFASLCGVTGIMAGYFEILQGSSAPDGFIISYIGPEFSMWKTYNIYDLLETYSAITIIPNFLFTGILSIIVSCLVIMWAVLFIHKKYGIIIFFMLSLTQLIVGGAFVMDLALITSITATRINKPLNWWRSHLSDKTLRLLKRIWPWSLMFYIILSFSLIGLSILGLNDKELFVHLDLAATLMFIPLILMIIGGFAYDINKDKTIN
jgi:hypothetical protein